jgi:hypothetical protein
MPVATDFDPSSSVATDDLKHKAIDLDDVPQTISLATDDLDLDIERTDTHDADIGDTGFSMRAFLGEQGTLVKYV